MSELLRVLVPALDAAAGRAFRPRDLDTIVVHNTGAIPSGWSAANGVVGEPGFNVIIAERGRPAYFCKCRPAGDPALTHEGTIGKILGREPTLAAHVAAMHHQPGDVMDILVVRRLPGRPYYEVLVKQDEAEWLASVERIVQLVERMAVRVAAALPALHGPSTLRLADEGRWGLEILTAQGLSPERFATLASALAQGGEVPAQLQHTDLWPPNVLVDGTSWYILDLELFGRVRVRLYDLLHMLHVCSDVRRPRLADHRSWAERFVTRDRVEVASIDMVWRIAQRSGLTANAAFGALVYYVVDMAARVKARGAWSADWREYLAQAERLADLIAAGATTADRLFKTGRG